LPHHINAPEFSQALVREFLRLCPAVKPHVA
jgi:hypothetical protein